MHIDDLILVSVDDHIVEPPNMTAFFEDRVPAKYKSRVPRVVPTSRTARTPGWSRVKRSSCSD